MPDTLAIDLARVQFALNISFHILFPAITIGLAWVLLFFRVRYTITRSQAWEYAYYFWVKIFALTFALGVVSGITMSFQFGTNWPGFMERAGNIAGPLLAYEVLTAFFLEAAFLGVMLYGKNRVSNTIHLAASAMVALGTSFSAFWILSLNSWMHTPQGYRIVDGVFFAEDWWEIIFNPSFPYRFTHMFIASLLTTAFVIAGVSAGRMLRKVDGPATLLVLKTGLVMAAILAPIQAFVGDQHGLNTRQYEPAKIAAVEAIWHTGKGVPLTLIGLPDEKLKTTRFAIEIPQAGSLILTHSWDGEVQGLDEFAGDHPPVAVVFWAFRIMVGMGMLMITVAWCASWSVFRNGVPSDFALRALSLMTFAGWVALLAGWYVTEVGRQPWLIYGLMRVEDTVAAHSEAVMLGTVTGYALLYAFLLVSYLGVLRYLSTKPAHSLALRDASRASSMDSGKLEQP